MKNFSTEQQVIALAKNANRKGLNISTIDYNGNTVYMNYRDGGYNTVYSIGIDHDYLDVLRGVGHRSETTALYN